MIKQKRYSQQREVILEVLRSTTSHPGVEWVYTQAKKRLPRLSLGTVYRNLRLLSERGEIQELDLGTGFARYDGNPKSHAHFLCQGCGRVLDIEEATAHINAGIVQSKGIKVVSYRLTFYGQCRDCQIK